LSAVLSPPNGRVGASAVMAAVAQTCTPATAGSSSTTTSPTSGLYDCAGKADALSSAASSASRGGPGAPRRRARRDGPYDAPMTPGREDDGLDRLSSKQLHDLAVHRARRHLDVKFYWRLMQYLPLAEAAEGESDEADVDLEFSLAHIDDVTDSGEGEVANDLRPFYLEYLREHGVTAGDATG
jgi:hypothetical protein